MPVLPLSLTTTLMVSASLPKVCGVPCRYCTFAGVSRKVFKLASVPVKVSVPVPLPPTVTPPPLEALRLPPVDVLRRDGQVAARVIDVTQVDGRQVDVAADIFGNGDVSRQRARVGRIVVDAADRDIASQRVAVYIAIVDRERDGPCQRWKDCRWCWYK